MAVQTEQWKIFNCKSVYYTQSIHCPYYITFINHRLHFVYKLDNYIVGLKVEQATIKDTGLTTSKSTNTQP